MTGFLIFLVGCGNNDSALDPTRNNNDDTPLQINKVSDSKGIDQHPTNRVKEILSAREDITSIRAANSAEKIAVAIDVRQMERFDLDDIRKSVREDIEQEFPTFEIKVSTDKKIYIELEKLEKEIETREISKEKLDKKIKKIIALENEQT